MEPEFSRKCILLTSGATIEIYAIYREDLEKPNWHYYETKDGKIHHFRKEHMVAVIEGISYKLVNRTSQN